MKESEYSVLIIPDKFKGSLSAQDVINAIKKGIFNFSPQVQTYEVLASDGGDGFLDAIDKYVSVDKVTIPSVDPLGRKIECCYLLDESSKTAYIEMATASGLVLLTKHERNPLKTSTYGTGLIIYDAIRRGSKKIYIGLGGSATNDGGTGMAAALGYQFLDENGNQLKAVGGSLSMIKSIDTKNVIPGLKDVDVYAINDVMNPLFGSKGATYVYGPQKGADNNMLQRLEAGLQNLHKAVRQDLNKDLPDIPGAGAAGGAGYGLSVFCGAQFISGIDFVLKLAKAEDLLSKGKVDIIITGEGKIDDQTAYGKLIRGVALMGGKYGIPVHAVCGKIQLKEKTASEIGLDQVVEIHDKQKPLKYSMEHAHQLIERAVSQILSKMIHI